jgi:FkbM family methyltransferase
MPGSHRAIFHLRNASRVSAHDAAFRTSFAGLIYEGSLKEHIDREIFYFGAYSPEELDFLEIAAQRLSGDGPLAYFDVGANVGQHSLWMSQRVAHVFAFEPSQRAIKQFQANIAANAIENITVLPIALGDRRESASLGSGLPNNSGSRSLLWSMEESAGETVEVYRGDDVLTERALPRIDILKLDVEGFESKALAGLRERLLKDRPVIMMELLGPEDCKGGFGGEAELKQALYPDCRLFVLRGPRRASLTGFSWASEEIVCLPEERVELFRDRIA